MGVTGKEGTFGKSYNGTSLQATKKEKIKKKKKMHSNRARRACASCRRVHTACDNRRPCGRCISLGRADQCVDLAAKKRGRPRRNGESDAGRCDSFLCEVIPPAKQRAKLSHGTQPSSPSYVLSPTNVAAPANSSPMKVLPQRPQATQHHQVT